MGAWGTGLAGSVFVLSNAYIKRRKWWKTNTGNGNAEEETAQNNWGRSGELGRRKKGIRKIIMYYISAQLIFKVIREKFSFFELDVPYNN